MPFRTAADGPSATESPTRKAPPTLLGFSAEGQTYRVIYQDRGAVRVAEIDRGSGRSLTRVSFGLAGDTVRAAMGREHWGVVSHDASRLELYDDLAPGKPHVLTLSPGDTVMPLVLDGHPHAVISHEGEASTPTRGPRASVLGGNHTGSSHTGWHAPSSARTLVAATSTVAGPVAVYTTDREDEIDVCVASRDGSMLERTVSLGQRQRFECAQGGGSRVLVVSRDDAGLVARTLASDVRSELNPVPIRPRTGWRVDAARCAYANGPFAIAHVETRDDVSFAVLTLFDAGQIQTHRLTLPCADGLAVDGKDVCVVAMIPAASAPVLLVHRSTRTGTHARHYAYFLEEPEVRTSYERRAVLVDIADILARAMGARTPSSFVLRDFDEHGDIATFVLPGLDPAHDVSVAVLMRDDGSGVTSLRVGGGAAPAPRGLHFVERMREAITGDDDGDPATMRIELESVSRGLESIVSAIGAFRAARGV